MLPAAFTAFLLLLVVLGGSIAVVVTFINHTKRIKTLEEGVIALERDLVAQRNKKPAP